MGRRWQDIDLAAATVVVFRWLRRRRRPHVGLVLPRVLGQGRASGAGRRRTQPDRRRRCPANPCASAPAGPRCSRPPAGSVRAPGASPLRRCRPTPGRAGAPTGWRPACARAVQGSGSITAAPDRVLLYQPHRQPCRVTTAGTGDVLAGLARPPGQRSALDAA